MRNHPSEQAADWSFLAMVAVALASQSKRAREAWLRLALAPIKRWTNAHRPGCGLREVARRAHQILAGKLLTSEAQRLSKMRRARIENWRIVGPAAVARLQGTVYGHPDHPDGTLITTSTIQSLGDHAVETRNTLYRLGKPARTE